MVGALIGGGISKVTVHMAGVTGRAGLADMAATVDMAGVVETVAVEAWAEAVALVDMAAEAEGIDDQPG